MKQKIGILLLLLALLTGQLPAAATERARETGETITGCVSEVNPLYRGVVDETDGADETDGDFSGTASEYRQSGEQSEGYDASKATYYTSIADAAELVRGQMANRQQIVTLAYRTTVASTSEDPKVSIVKGIVAKALEETGNENEGDYLRWQYGRYVCNIQGDSVANGDGTSTYSYKFIYSFEYYTTAEQERTLNETLTEALRGLNLSQATDYQKIDRIYDYICDHVSYDGEDTTTQKYTAYSALERGTAVCQGYALLLYRMLREAGFSTRIIAGTATASGENHAWNIVRLGDVYYYLDSTWDAGNANHNYFLRGTGDFPGHQAWEDYTTEDFAATYPVAESKFEADAADDPALGVLGAGTCGDGITWSLSADGVLTLRGSGKMDNYRAGKTPWAELTDNITALDIGCGITAIGSDAFSGCTALNTAVVLPDTVEEIGGGAFAGCTALPSVDILPQTATIASGAFPAGTVLRGCAGSAAETAASAEGLTFEAAQSIADAAIQLSQTTYVYTGTACTPEVTVTAADGAAVPHSVQYCDNVFAGTAQAVVSGGEGYAGKTAVSFSIEKATPQVQAPQGLSALCGQELSAVLLSAAFAWQQPEQEVGMSEHSETFYLTYTPLDTDNYVAVTDIPVTVSVRDSIGLSSVAETSYVGAEVRLIASAFPRNAPSGLLTWSSDAPEVASVASDGIVTVNGQGTATITVRSVTGAYAQCEMTVGQLPFTDVAQGAWYYDAVAYAHGHGLFSGMTPTTFKPNANMTRAMLVQVLYSMSGAPEVTESSPFSDVPDGKWYTDAIVWASGNGVVSGTGNGEFSPNAHITREQTAVMLHKYAGLYGYSTSYYVSLSSYEDDQDVSNWAIHSMQWAVGNGLISGTPNNELQPRGKATRAQLAQIMMQFCYNIVCG